MRFSKLAISPVVATALLLVVAVVSVVGFQGWFTSFSSGLMIDVEGDTASSVSAVRVDGIINNELYLNSNSENVDLKSLSVLDSSGVQVCDFNSNSQNLSGLVGHWKFDDKSNIIKDYSGNGHNGKLYGISRLLLDFDNAGAVDKTSWNNTGVINGASWTNVGCVSGGCYNFDKSNDEYIYFENVSLNESYAGVSFSLWGKFNTLNTSQALISRGGGNWGPYNHWSLIKYGDEYIYFRTGKWTGDGGDGFKYVNSTFSPNAGEWNHYVGNLFYDSVLNETKMQLYIDTKLYIDKIYPGQLLATIDDRNIFLGAQTWSSFPTNNPEFTLNGSIDEVSVYSKFLSSTDVKKLYDLKKSEFIEFSDSGLIFNGKNSYVEVLDDDNLDGFSDMTIVASFRPFGFGGGTVYNKMLQFSGSGNDDAYILNVMDDFTFRDVSSNLTNYQFNNINFTKLKNFVTVKTYDSSINKFYINGDLVWNNSFSGPINSINSNLYFGTAIKLNGELFTFYDGLIDEIRIYDRVLLDNEVEALYLDLSTNNLGINKIDLSSCNLSSNSKYEIVGTTDKGLFNYEVVSR